MNQNDAKWKEYGEQRLLSKNRLILQHHRILNEYFLDYFKSVDTSAKVLDIGCGEGFYLRGVGLLSSRFDKLRQIGRGDVLSR